VRILHVVSDYHPAMGGAELFTKEVSERLAARGHEVTVLALNSRGLAARDGERLQSREIVNGVRVRRIDGTYQLHARMLNTRGAYRALSLVLSGDRLQMFLAGPCSLRAFMFTLFARADVVGLVNWYHGSLAYQTCLARGIRNFSLVGIPLLHTERPWASVPLLSRLLARCDGVAVMTDHERIFIEKRCKASNVHVVAAGIEPGMFLQPDGCRIRRIHSLGEAPVVGYVGRMSATKGVVTLIEAMKIVWRTLPAARVLLAGSGLPSSGKSDADVAAAFARLSEDERSRVVSISRFDDVEKASIFDAIDVFAMPSVAESFGIAYLEAWMCGKAVVGSRFGSTACVIQDGIDGTLVTPDDPQELAGAILRLLSDRELRERMGRAGRAKTLASFTWERVVDRVEALYERTRGLGERGRRPVGAVA